MNTALDLTMENLETMEAPMTDKQAGLLVGGAAALGLIAGAFLAVAILT